MSLFDVAAVCFDLDDTLCAYWDASRAALKDLFAEFASENVSAAQLSEAWVESFHEICPRLKDLGLYEKYLETGQPTRDELMIRALKKCDIDDKELGHRMGDAYHVKRQAALRLFPDAIDVLSTLHQTYKLGLITNGPADVQREEVLILGIEQYFSCFCIEGELKRGKPHAEVFERAEKELGASGSKMLMVGNSYNHDIVPAIQHGWRTLWVRRPSDVPPSSKNKDAKPEERPEGGPTPDGEITDLLSVLRFLRTGTN